MFQSILDSIASGASKEVAREAYESGEDISLDWWDRLRGATDESVQNSYNRVQQKDLNTRLGAQFAAVGSTGADFGETYQQALGKINRLQTERQAGQDAKALAQQLKIQETSQRPQMAQIAAQTKATEDSNALLREQMLRQEKTDLLDRADARDARSQELRLQIMQMDRADQRYNEQLDRQDRKDRQASIQTLVSGLAHLGAAFAA